MNNFKAGDRLTYRDGTEYRIHAVYPSGSAMIGMGATDRLAVTKDELSSFDLSSTQPPLPSLCSQCSLSSQ
ncbi:MAG: hypothetical protein HC799_19370 [Limnothrix sp. RL_2_0]|nr:hypothetical protein [Limnothrix sp. RL_2_0]